MKITIAGGTGFVGKALLKRLVALDHSVVVLTRDPERAGRAIPGNVLAAGWDGMTQGSWCAHIDGADAVINLAGESLTGKRWTPLRKERLAHSRIHATNAIVEAIKNAKERPAVLVSASAVGFYGHVENEPVTEDWPKGEGFLSELCAAWESSARVAEQCGVRVVLLRLGVVLGERGGALQKLLLQFKLFLGGPPGTGRQWFPWIHRDDVVEIVLFAVQQTALVGPVNVAAPQSVTMKEFCGALGRTLHRPSWLAVPAVLLRTLLGEMSAVVLTGQRLIPARLCEAGYTFKYPELLSSLRSILH